MKILFALIHSILFGILYLVLEYWVDQKDFYASLFQKVDLLSTFISSYSFTMLGFLAALISIIFSYLDKPFFKKYTSDGRFGVFLFVFLICIIHLSLTFVFSLMSFLNVTLFNLMITSVLISFLYIIPFSRFFYGLANPKSF